MNDQKFTLEATGDGSFTFFSAEFGESFHSHFGARQEAEYKFVRPVKLRSKAHQPILRLLDVCYGLGYNTASALTAIWEVNPDCQVEWIGLELDPDVPKAAIASGLLDCWPDEIKALLTELSNYQYFKNDKISASMLMGDGRTTIQQVQKLGFQADAIFLDPFSPPNCPQLWTVEFLRLVSRCLKVDGHLATYSCAASVRGALRAAGLSIGSTPPVGRRSPGTVASFSASDLPKLCLKEEEHLLTKAAIPYRDPHLSDLPEAIVYRRLLEKQTSLLEPTSRWKKRWSHRF